MSNSSRNIQGGGLVNRFYRSGPNTITEIRPDGSVGATSEIGPLSRIGLDIAEFFNADSGQPDNRDSMAMRGAVRMDMMMGRGDFRQDGDFGG